MVFGVSMVKIERCSFCGRIIQPGTGMIYVKSDGTVLRFCSSKCFKSMVKLGRDPSRFPWTLKYKGKK